jgi:hypothetical protein
MGADRIMNLTFHGKTKEACEWVVENYKNYKLYSDNKTIQQWLKESEERLHELETQQE